MDPPGPQFTSSFRHTGEEHITNNTKKKKEGASSSCSSLPPPTITTPNGITSSALLHDSGLRQYHYYHHNVDEEDEERGGGEGGMIVARKKIRGEGRGKRGNQRLPQKEEEEGKTDTAVLREAPSSTIMPPFPHNFSTLPPPSSSSSSTTSFIATNATTSSSLTSVFPTKEKFSYLLSSFPSYDPSSSSPWGQAQPYYVNAHQEDKFTSESSLSVFQVSSKEQHRGQEEDGRPTADDVVRVEGGGKERMVSGKRNGKQKGWRKGEREEEEEGAGIYKSGVGKSKRRDEKTPYYSRECDSARWAEEEKRRKSDNEGGKRKEARGMRERRGWGWRDGGAAAAGASTPSQPTFGVMRGGGGGALLSSAMRPSVSHTSTSSASIPLPPCSSSSATTTTTPSPCQSIIVPYHVCSSRARVQLRCMWYSPGCRVYRVEHLSRHGEQVGPDGNYTGCYLTCASTTTANTSSSSSSVSSSRFSPSTTDSTDRTPAPTPSSSSSAGAPGGTGTSPLPYPHPYFHHFFEGPNTSMLSRSKGDPLTGIAPPPPPPLPSLSRNVLPSTTSHPHANMSSSEGGRRGGGVFSLSLLPLAEGAAPHHSPSSRLRSSCTGSGGAFSSSSSLSSFIKGGGKRMGRRAPAWAEQEGERGEPPESNPLPLPPHPHNKNHHNYSTGGGGGGNSTAMRFSAGFSSTGAGGGRSCALRQHNPVDGAVRDVLPTFQDMQEGAVQPATLRTVACRLFHVNDFFLLCLILTIILQPLWRSPLHAINILPTTPHYSLANQHHNSDHNHTKNDHYYHDGSGGWPPSTVVSYLPSSNMIITTEPHRVEGEKVPPSSKEQNTQSDSTFSSPTPSFFHSLPAVFRKDSFMCLFLFHFILLPVMLLFPLWRIIAAWRRIYLEEIVVVAGVGIYMTSYGLWNNVVESTFVDVCQLRSLFIHDAFCRYQPIFFLSATVESWSSRVVLFPHTLPRLDIIVPVLRGMRAVLFGEAEFGLSLAEMEERKEEDEEEEKKLNKEQTNEHIQVEGD